MTVSNSHRRRALLVFMGLVAVSILFHERIIGSVAYAVEKGKLEASGEHLALAKVEAISEAFRTVARRVRPAVVRIETTTDLGARSSRRRDPEDLDLRDLPEPFREFFKDWHQFRRFPEVPPHETGGSGVIIDAQDGFILTNNHVVKDAAENEGRIDVRLPDGRRLEGKIVGRDPETDLALVKIEADRLHALALGDSEGMEVGDWVLAIGAPFGLEQSVTQGIISAKGRSHILEIGYQNLLQTDAAINPGNSGGPLVNMRGEVIGINTAIATNALMRGYMGIGFAIPSETVKEILPALKEGREIVRGYLGLAIKDPSTIAPGFWETFGLKEEASVYLEDVYPDTPASKAGLKGEDIILKYDGQRLESVAQLQELVARTKPGTTVDLVVWRDGKEITIPVTIEKMPKDFFAWARGRDRGLPSPGGDEDEETTIDAVGMTVAPLTRELSKRHGWDEADDLEGLLVVTEVAPLGEARALGIRPGDLIVSVQGEKVNTGRALRRALNDEALEKGVRIYVRTTRYGYRTFFLQLDRRR